MVVLGQVKIENSSLPVAVRVSKTRVLKLPNYLIQINQSRLLISTKLNFSFLEGRWERGGGGGEREAEIHFLSLTFKVNK